jgi:hypothetical protein
MKTDRVIRQSMIFLLSTIALFVVPHALAYNDATIEEADKSYQQGITAFNKKHWSYAKRYFVESFDYIPHSMTAYMLSVTFLKMESPDDALDYARKAMNSEPELEEPYSTGVKEIADWAREAKVDPYYCRIEVKTDTWDETKPASPKYRPPRPVVPQSRTLGIKPDPNVNVVKPFVTAKIIKPRDFTGKWRCNDGGIYLIRQVGTELWWYGQSQDAGKSWSNVFHGQIKGNQVTGKWADVPHGRTRNSGDMSLQIVGNNKLRAIHKRGGFGGSEWTR